MEEFLTYAKTLRTPTIYNAIRHAKRLDGVARYGFPASVRWLLRQAKRPLWVKNTDGGRSGFGRKADAG
jgi:hypothetical protein